MELVNFKNWWLISASDPKLSRNDRGTTISYHHRWGLGVCTLKLMTSLLNMNISACSGGSQSPNGCHESHKVKAPETFPYGHGYAHSHQQRSIHNCKQATILSLHKSSVASGTRRVDATRFALTAKYEHCCMALYGMVCGSGTGIYGEPQLHFPKLLIG